MTATNNNSLKPLKCLYMRETYGAYGYIYYKHTIQQRTKYGITNPSYRELYNIPKANSGKSRFYI